jgi:hypothetical protein
MLLSEVAQYGTRKFCELCWLICCVHPFIVTDANWTAPQINTNIVAYLGHRRQWIYTDGFTLSWQSYETCGPHIPFEPWKKIIRAVLSLLIKGKAAPLQAWCGPEGSRKLRFPDLMTTEQDVGKVVSLTHWLPLPPGNTPGTHFC